MAKKAFTLLELIIVVIVVGVLATLGFIEYNQTIERSRSTEAKANLSLLRRLQIGRYEEKGSYGFLSDLVGSELPESYEGYPGNPCSSTAPGKYHYFHYYCQDSDGKCFAYRCFSGGKPPPISPASASYQITVTPDGVWGGTPGYY